VEERKGPSAAGGIHHLESADDAPQAAAVVAWKDGEYFREEKVEFDEHQTPQQLVVRVGVVANNDDCCYLPEETYSYITVAKRT